MELVNEYSPTGNFMKVDTTFCSESKLKKELMPAVPLSGNYRCKVEMECYVKFGPTLGWIQKIVNMSRIDSFYTAIRLVTRTVSLTLTDLKGLKRCVQYMASHPHKYVFYPFNYYDVSNIIWLTWIGTQVEDYTAQNCLKIHQDTDHDIILNRRR